MAGKVIDFPCDYEYLEWCAMSSLKLKAIIEVLNMSNEKGFLDKRQFQALLDYCGVDPHQDFTDQDRAILQFHIDNYYDLDIQV